MTDEMKLLVAFIKASGYSIQHINGEWSVTKKPKASKGVRQAEYTTEFEQAWRLYPRRAGTNPKDKAFQQWNLRLKEGDKEQDLINGTMRYAECLKKTNKIGSEYVLQAQTFYGPSKHYKAEFKVAESVVLKLPANNDDLLMFASQNNMPQPGIGQSWQDYRRKLNQILESRT